MELQMWGKGSESLQVSDSYIYTCRGGPRNKQEMHHPQSVPMGGEEFPAPEECWLSYYA